MWGVGFGVWGLGCGVWGVGLRMWGVGCGEKVEVHPQQFEFNLRKCQLSTSVRFVKDRVSIAWTGRYFRYSGRGSDLRGAGHEKAVLGVGALTNSTMKRAKPFQKSPRGQVGSTSLESTSW